MAFFYAPNDPGLSKPRDASSIYRRPKYDAANNVVSLVTLLLLVAVAYGLYLLYVGPAPTHTAIIAPPDMQSAPTQQVPAPQPSPTTP